VQLGQQHVVARLLGTPWRRLLRAEFSGLPLALALLGAHWALVAAGWRPWPRLVLETLVLLTPALLLAIRRGRRGAWEWLTGGARSPS
jgi:hypothetical protein